MAITLKASCDGRAFILPRENAAEASLVENATVFPARSLLDVCAHLSGMQRLEPQAEQPPVGVAHYADFSEVKGQAQAKRALEIAAAGGHSVLMSGPPGTGKSMLAARFPGILPSMTQEEALEAAAVQSLTGSFTLDAWGRRAFRSPHHSSSSVALVGGGWAAQR